MCLRVFLCCLALCILQKPALAYESAEQMARQVVDQLMNMENDKADASILALQQQYPDYPLLGFIKVAPLWAKAEASYDETARQNTLHRALNILAQNIQSAQLEISKHPDNVQWQLSLGLSQAFSGLAYMRLGEWLNAYHAGRAGRDTLRAVVQSHPDIEDAYFVLGFYEYHTGSLPFYLSWLTWLVDMSGDSELGLAYIHRAIEYAPIFSPEASRLLLTQTESNQSNACKREKLAEMMAKHYPKNSQFPWLKQQMQRLCLQ